MSLLDTSYEVDIDAIYAYGSSSTIQKKNVGGYCNSEKCVELLRSTKSKNPNYKYMIFNDVRILKTTEKFRINCPDCGHALLWDVVTEDNQPMKATMAPKR